MEPHQTLRHHLWPYKNEPGYICVLCGKKMDYADIEEHEKECHGEVIFIEPDEFITTEY